MKDLWEAFDNTLDLFCSVIMLIVLSPLLVLLALIERRH